MSACRERDARASSVAFFQRDLQRVARLHVARPSAKTLALVDEFKAQIAEAKRLLEWHESECETCAEVES